MSKGYISFSYARLREALQLPENYSIYAIVDHTVNEGVTLIVESPDIPAREKQHGMLYPPPRVQVDYEWHADHDGKSWQRLSSIEVKS